MYLKSIRIEGFKSFANKTIFELKKGITAIVGPNGSGKSNIVDAIRWVLGEQSVKSLRGGNQMSDVIFSGSSTKNEMNKASVTLVFDNHDHYLNIDYDEVEVKRCVYKDGDNDYYLNNNKVRLKDVTDLFIDSGASSSAFNIISQGTVQDIVNSKPNERRVIFESAAGVLKYKKRKEESIKKLEKTKDNIGSINLVINELLETLTPLKSQAEVASKYLEIKDNLKDIEVSLAVKDITDINKETVNLEQEKERLTSKLEGLDKNDYDNEKEKIKLEIYKIDDEINEKNNKTLNLTKEISNLDSEKRIAIERTKYEYSNDAVKSNLINLKEEELKYIKDIEIINKEIDTLNENIKDKKETFSKVNTEYQNLALKKNTYNKELEELSKDKNILENKIDILNTNILNNEKVPYSVKNILNNPRLKGIHNTLANLIETNNDYEIALDVVMQSSANFLIVDNELVAKDAINYLKDNKLGRATFLPLNIIKSRYIAENIKERLTSINGYVGILSDLIQYDKIYQNIIENQFGNIILAKDIDSMNLIAKIMEYKYRVVSLDGSIIYAGGSISGGGVNKNSNINLKKELLDNKEKLEKINIKLEDLTLDLKNISSEYDILSSKIEDINREMTVLDAKKNSKISILDEEEEKLKTIKNDILSFTNLKENTINSKLNELMEKENVLVIEKEKLEKDLENIKNKKRDLNEELNNLEIKSNKISSEYKELNNNLNNVNVTLAKNNIKLDNLLLTLNEDYNLTYEFAKLNYELEIDVDLARKEVHKLKDNLKSLGDVNVGSISEYERINTRYNFLLKQKEDLELSMTGLNNIIMEMDDIMKEKFMQTFTKIKDEFQKVFKIMFQGGEGRLELTDPNDFLNTGIDMIIIPPGKKIHNTQSLSGGEKSLTAICLLFAILNVSPVPFIILDEVEAALDEVNVDLFGEYLNKKKAESQYILITHKKRMMEYADVLYGITMQNAGISKVVGVKLES